MRDHRAQHAAIARETVTILEHGRYHSLTGASVSIAASLALAKGGTTLYTPQAVHELLTPQKPVGRRRQKHTSIEVTNETTLHTTHRLICEEHESRVICLNFASATRPGGGFLHGSRAQEESLARASGLYACLLQQPDFYKANRAVKSGGLYTDAMIYSPDVPVFRNEHDLFLEEPYVVSILTAPAVNRGVVERQASAQVSRIEDIMRRRIQAVLSICFVHDHPVLVLGAWGCGAFKNPPEQIARLFAESLLDSESFRSAFKRVVFAVFDRSHGKPVFTAFNRRLGGKKHS